MNTKEIIDRIFKDPKTQYDLTEFESLGKPVHNLIEIYPKTIESGRDAGKTRYYIKSFVPFSSGKEEAQVYVEGGKSNPEEIVRILQKPIPLFCTSSMCADYRVKVPN